MQAQFGAPTAGGVPPKISKQKAKEIFLDSEEKKFHMMKEVMAKQGGGM